MTVAAEDSDGVSECNMVPCEQMQPECQCMPECLVDGRDAHLFMMRPSQHRGNDEIRDTLQQLQLKLDRHRCPHGPKDAGTFAGDGPSSHRVAMSWNPRPWEEPGQPIRNLVRLRALWGAASVRSQVRLRGQAPNGWTSSSRASPGDWRAEDGVRGREHDDGDDPQRPVLGDCGTPPPGRVQPSDHREDAGRRRRRRTAQSPRRPGREEWARRRDQRQSRSSLS